ncbi:MAG: cob(I)yrinic acid a,c-diamide adenosyltransferase [Candidatus Marinimicrobia bacterium]|nr:cob(I)yrinic acid a,c-diamide adenosyltransferase [Candidatus Neomarinimicrobiota bacterium]MCH7762131.1 cob(I)yrinic acid a,c-diamide adenosyltransferase [Candidatus Neomarinimicrobiota bacterium]
MRITKVTTRTGDRGETGLGDGSRVQKDDIRIQCLGAIDELNSFIGFGKTAVNDKSIISFLESIQQDLFNIGGELSLPGKEIMAVDVNRIVELESSVLEWNEGLPQLKEFILPGGAEASSRMHLVRTSARRAERKLIQLHQSEPVSDHCIMYFNRLSDVFFVLARKLQREEGVNEKQWKHE